MGRGDSSGGLLHLGPVAAFESVDNRFCLYIKPYWLAILNKKEDNFLRTTRGFSNLFCKFCADNVRPYIESAKPQTPRMGVGNAQMAGSRHLS